jgi:hypothetical protein
MSILDSSVSKWRKSSFSESGNCVEVLTQGKSVLIRDTKRREDGLLSFSPPAWREFVQVVRNSRT